jgi:hypothetical protein
MSALSRFFFTLVFIAPLLFPAIAHAGDTQGAKQELQDVATPNGMDILVGGLGAGGNDDSDADRPYLPPPSTGGSRAQTIGLAIPLAVMTLAAVGLGVALAVVHITDNNCDNKYDRHFSNESACNSSAFFDALSHVSSEVFEQVKDACFVIISNNTITNHTSNTSMPKTS